MRIRSCFSTLGENLFKSSSTSGFVAEFFKFIASKLWSIVRQNLSGIPFSSNIPLRKEITTFDDKDVSFLTNGNRE